MKTSREKEKQSEGYRDQRREREAIQRKGGEKRRNWRAERKEE